MVVGIMAAFATPALYIRRAKAYGIDAKCASGCRSRRSNLNDTNRHLLVVCRLEKRGVSFGTTSRQNQAWGLEGTTELERESLQRTL